jgi:hypothetical protein
MFVIDHGCKQTPNPILQQHYYCEARFSYVQKVLYIL